MTQHFSREQINEFRQCFNLYASDGTVTNDAQLRFIIRSLGYAPTIPETKAYIKKFGNLIDFAKFLEILHAEDVKAPPVTEISKALQNLDRKNRGFVSKSEFATLLTSFGEKMSRDEVEMVLRVLRIQSDVVPIAKIIQYMS
uniref:EF-hand domain-containing protein n=1 Tax=Panagrolaimus sp. JU765 TaxID=591449 RepID=A0AC34QGK6_9BILA